MNNQDHRPNPADPRSGSSSTILLPFVVLIDSPIWINCESYVASAIKLRIVVFVHKQINAEEVFYLLNYIH